MTTLYEDQSTSCLLELAEEGFPNVTLKELASISASLTAKLLAQSTSDDRNAWMEVCCQALKNAVAAATLTSNPAELRMLKSCLEQFLYALNDAIRCSSNIDELARYREHTENRLAVVDEALRRIAELFGAEDTELFSRRPSVH